MRQHGVPERIAGEAFKASMSELTPQLKTKLPAVVSRPERVG